MTAYDAAALGVALLLPAAGFGAGHARLRQIILPAPQPMPDAGHRRRSRIPRTERRRRTSRSSRRRPGVPDERLAAAGDEDRGRAVAGLRIRRTRSGRRFTRNTRRRSRRCYPAVSGERDDRPRHTRTEASTQQRRCAAVGDADRRTA